MSYVSRITDSPKIDLGSIYSKKERQLQSFCWECEKMQVEIGGKLLYTLWRGSLAEMFFCKTCLRANPEILPLEDMDL